MQREKRKTEARTQSPVRQDRRTEKNVDGGADNTRSDDGSMPNRPWPSSQDLARSVLPSALGWGLIVALIFGGCCSNVFALEAIIRADPDAGLLLTFAQFVPVVIFELPKHVSFVSQPPYLRVRLPVIPLWRWVPSIVMFFAVNVLNNFAFGHDISVPVHIILRSGGSVLTMVVGYVSGKRFSRAQVLGVILLTIGVVTAAMSDAASKAQPGAVYTSATFGSKRTSATGLFYLFVAALLSAFMGLYVQNTYATYGPHWQENLFYTHFLSLPLFLPFLPSLRQKFDVMRTSPPWTISITTLELSRPSSTGVGRGFSFPQTTFSIPEKLVFLTLNGLTQYACIRGVNLLAARTSALGVTVVLNIRKLISLLASIWLFGNSLPFGVMLGAAVVFSGAGVYALGGSKSRETTKPKVT